METFSIHSSRYNMFINVSDQLVGGEVEGDVTKLGVGANSTKMTIQKMKGTLRE